LFAAEGKPIRILGGLNFAQGGSKTKTPRVPGNSMDSMPHSAAVQIQNYLKDFGAFHPDQLIVLWIGCNDVIAPFGNNVSPTMSVDQQAMNSGNGVSQAVLAAAEENAHAAAEGEVDLAKDILAHGASRLVVINIIDMGLATFQPDTSPAGLKLASQLTTVFNMALAAAFPHDSRLLLVDADALFRKAANDHGPGGFKHVAEDACNNHFYICSPAEYVEKDANETYMFAGYGHLTQHSRRLLASAVAEQVNARWPTRTNH
jgi:phospholipase/lecithinase/hemolysin